MARPPRPERSRSARSSRQLSRFYHSINPDRVFGTHSWTKERGRQLRRPYIFSETHVRLPHWHSNMWNVRPVGGSSILLINFGCPPHFKQRGEVGFWLSCFSMPHRNPGTILRASELSARSDHESSLAGAI